MPEQEDTRHWHLDKRLNIGHITATALIVITMFSWMNKIDTRITTLESSQLAVQQLEELRQNYNDRIHASVASDLKSINIKMDKILEEIRRDSTERKR